MKRSESDGTDLSISKKVKLSACIAITLLAQVVSANHLYLYSNKDTFQGILMTNTDTYATEVVLNKGVLEGLLTTASDSVNSVNDGTGSSLDSVNDGTGSSLDSVNDGTGSSLDSVNDGTGSSLDSVNDGTGSSLDSVNDGTGGLPFTINLSMCNSMLVDTKNGAMDISLSSVSIDNAKLDCH